MFTGEGSFNAGYEKEDEKQEPGVTDGSKGKKTTKNQKGDVRGW